MYFYRKKAMIEVLEVLENYDVVVCNVGNEDYKWIIPKDVFESTYEEVSV